MVFRKSAAASNTTIIALKNNFLAGDTVLYLKEQNVKTSYFLKLGGCGNVESGDLFMIDKAYNYESFSKCFLLTMNLNSSHRLMN